MSANADATINLYANDEASSTIRSASQGIKSDLEGVKGSLYTNSDAWKAQNMVVRDTMRQKALARRSFQLEHETFFETTKLMGKVGNMGMKLNSTFMTMNTMVIRKTQLEKEHRDAMQAQSEAMLEAGRDSDEYRAATERVNEAQQALNQLAFETPGQLLGVGMAFVGLAGDIGQVVAAYKDLRFNAKAAGNLKLPGGGSTSKTLSTAETLTASATGNLVTGAKGIGGKIKQFAGSRVGQVLLPLTAALTTYEALTETDEGKWVNQNLNPYTKISSGIMDTLGIRNQVEDWAGSLGFKTEQNSPIFEEDNASGHVVYYSPTYNYNGMEQEQIDRMKRGTELSSVLD